MTQAQCLETLLARFTRYYDVSRDVCPPFCAQALFHSREEHYFLTKSAKLAVYASSERVYFALAGRLSAARLQELSVSAWEQGLEGVAPFWGHKSSDVSLIVIAQSIDEDAFRAAKRIRYYRSYRLSLFGWSAFALAAFDMGTHRCASNNRGRRLSKLFAPLATTSA